MNFSFKVDKNLLTASLLFRNNPKDEKLIGLKNEMWNKHREAYDVFNGNYKTIFMGDYKVKLENIVGKTEALLTDTEKLPLYKKFYQETLDYRTWLENEWNHKKVEVAKHLMDIVKIELPPKDFEVLVIHPAVGVGCYLGDGKIFWGHSEDWGNYSLVYLIHEALHGYFGDSELTHALIELIADNELRTRLNGGGEYFKCDGEEVGHDYLRSLEQKLLPAWKKYLKQGANKGNIFDLVKKYETESKIKL
jgi:hypothetical protein